MSLASSGVLLPADRNIIFLSIISPQLIFNQELNGLTKFSYICSCGDEFYSYSPGLSVAYSTPVIIRITRYMIKQHIPLITCSTSHLYVDDCFQDASTIDSLSLYVHSFSLALWLRWLRLPVTLSLLLYTVYFHNQITLWLLPKQPHLEVALRRLSV